MCPDLEFRVCIVESAANLGTNLYPNLPKPDLPTDGDSVAIPIKSRNLLKVTISYSHKCVLNILASILGQKIP